MPVKIRTWAERLNDFPDMQITTSMDVQMAMQAEIDELREALVMAQSEAKCWWQTTKANQEELETVWRMYDNLRKEKSND